MFFAFVPGSLYGASLPPTKTFEEESMETDDGAGAGGESNPYVDMFARTGKVQHRSGRTKIVSQRKINELSPRVPCFLFCFSDSGEL